MISRAKPSKQVKDKTKADANQNKNNVDLKKRAEIEEALSSFQYFVNSDVFYEVADSILIKISDPQTLATCAELASKREPGGPFYRAKFWAETIKALSLQHNGNLSSEFRKLCTQIGVSPTTAKTYVAQGNAIQAVEEALVNTARLRKASAELFKNAHRQKERASEYLIEAIDLLNQNPELKHTQIHRNWCQKNGSIKANLDIIKPSDWWAFSHPKWRREKDFSGSIPGEVYANALYYFAPRSGVAVDPMAGSGMLKRVYDDRELWQKDTDFNLDIRLYDLHPQRKFIKKHDARKPLPIKADWIFIDPSYYGQSSHLFKDELASTQDYNEYVALMEEVIQALANSLKSKGRLCIFLPKWSGFQPEDPNHNTPSDIYAITVKAGLHWIDTAFVSRGRQQEPGSATKNNVAKRNRRMWSDTCVLNVFEKPEGV